MVLILQRIKKLYLVNSFEVTSETAYVPYDKGFVYIKKCGIEIILPDNNNNR